MTASVRSATATLLVGLVASLLAVVPTTSASADVDQSMAPAAERASSSISPVDPMPHEDVTWTAPTGLKRTSVALQILTNKGWEPLRSYRTDAAGVATVIIRGGEVGTVAKYRLRRKGKTLLRRRVTTVQQTVALAAPVDIGGNQVILTATFTPARRGRRGALVMDAAQGMTHWDSQNAAGQISFRVTRPGTGSSMTFRAFALARKGAAPSDFSNAQTVTSLN